jgi:hypothetical protein
LLLYNTYRSCPMDRFFVIKVQMINPTVQNDVRMNI